MSMTVTSFNTVRCNKCRVFTHPTGWWNQLNTLGNTFIRKNVSIFKLRTNEIRLVFLWMLFMDQFSPLVMLSSCSLPSNIRKTIYPGDEAVVLRQYSNYFAKCILLRTHSVLHVMNIRYGDIPHFIVYLYSYWIYWFWNLFWLLLFLCGKIK